MHRIYIAASCSRGFAAKYADHAAKVPAPGFPQSMHRKWRSFVDRTRGGPVIRVLQFNILADSLADGADICPSTPVLPSPHLCEHGAAGCHYHFQADAPCHTFRTPKLNLDWEYRKPQILQILQHSNADVICLQEVDCFADLQATLRTCGFQGSFCKKAWKKIKDGSAVFWRERALRLLDRMTLQILPGSAMTAMLLRLATWDGKHVVVCATHLKAGFSAEMEEHRVAQADALQKHLQKFAGDEAETAIIIAADLNAHHSPYAVCTAAMCNDPGALVEPKAIQSLLEGGYRSAYPEFPSFTAWSGWLDRDVFGLYFPERTCADLGCSGSPWWTISFTMLRAPSEWTLAIRSHSLVGWRGTLVRSQSATLDANMKRRDVWSEPDHNRVSFWVE